MSKISVLAQEVADLAARVVALESRAAAQAPSAPPRPAAVESEVRILTGADLARERGYALPGFAAIEELQQVVLAQHPSLTPRAPGMLPETALRSQARDMAAAFRFLSTLHIAQAVDVKRDLRDWQIDCETWLGSHGSSGGLWAGSLLVAAIAAGVPTSLTVENGLPNFGRTYFAVQLSEYGGMPVRGKWRDTLKAGVPRLLPPIVPSSNRVAAPASPSRVFAAG